MTWTTGSVAWTTARCGIALSLFGASALVGEEVEIEAIITGLRHANARVTDYEMTYRTSVTFHYREVYSETERVGPRNKFRKLVGYNPKTESERRKKIVSTYRWRSKAPKFAFERDYVDEINELQEKQKHAFDGERQLYLYQDDDRAILEGVINTPQARYGGIPGDVLQPREFATHLLRSPIEKWLTSESVTVGNEESHLGIPTYPVAVLRHKTRAKFWFCPKYDLRPTKITCTLPSGQECVYEVIKMKKVAEGIWVPVRGTVTWHKPSLSDDGSTFAYSVTNYEVDEDSLRVNAGIDDRHFSFEFPNGTQVDDRVLGRRYTIGRD